MPAKKPAGPPAVIEIPTVELLPEFADMLPPGATLVYDTTPILPPLPEPEQPQPIPVPATYRAEWWPAAVRLPGQPQPIPVAKVFATRDGLYVYRSVPADQNTGMPPDFYSPIHYDKTPQPRTGYAAQQAGVQIVTEAGVVIVQALGGCGCSYRALKTWRPAWANRCEAWEA